MRNLDVGQIVQIVANLGVIASIVFLGIQVQQNSAIQRAQARAMRAEIRIDGAMARSTNIELLNANLKERRGEPLSDLDEMLLGLDARAVLAGWQYIYGEYREGLIDEADVPLEDWRRAFARSQSYTRVWQNADGTFRPDFVAWMNENVVGKNRAGSVSSTAIPGTGRATPEAVALPPEL